MRGDFRPESWYREILSSDVPASQGDQLFGATFPLPIRSKTDPSDHDIIDYYGDFIVVTQSCDLEQRKVARVELVTVYPLVQWLYFNPSELNDLDSIRSGGSHRYYLLPAWVGAPFEVVRTTRVVEFDQKFSVAWDEFDEALEGDRLGLRSPYVEHFGQAVARFYMRVGLPEDMPQIAAKQDPEQTPTKHKLTNDNIARVDIHTIGPAIEQLPTLTSSMDVIVQKVRLPGHPDTLYKARLEQRGHIFGVAAKAEDALGSLARFLVAKYAEVEGGRAEGEDANWIRNAFGSSHS